MSATRTDRLWVVAAALLLSCQGSVGPATEEPDGAPLDGKSAPKLDKGKPKLDKGKPKLDKPKPKLDKPKPKLDKPKPPDLCKPLPKGCLCALACQKGVCDNTRCPCKPIPGASYGATLPPSNPSKTDPAKHVDVNLLMRKKKSVGFKKGLVKINGPTDPNQPPQLYSLFVNNRVPAFPHVYQVQDWQWGCNCFKGYVSKPEVTLAGMATALNEVIRTPKSSYNVGGGNTAIVLLATKNTITLKYTGDDDVVKGYTIHISGICVEPKLQKLYDQCHKNGRKKLPALKNTQPLGRAIYGEIQVAIRDTGAWMDPRSSKDWWQGK